MKKNTNINKSKEILDFIDHYKTKSLNNPLAKEEDYVQLGRVLSAAVTNDKHVPLSPFGRNRFLKDSKPLVTQVNQQLPKARLELNWSGIDIKEAEAIVELVEFGLEFYGDPVFDYHSVQSIRYEDVDFWRNLIKIGRETSNHSAEDRISSLKDLTEAPETGRWNPDYTHLAAGQVACARSYNKSIVSRDKHTFNVSYSSEKSTTNSGSPWYRRKSKSFDDVPIRELIASRSKSLSLEEQMGQPAFLGARNQRGKWTVKGYDNAEELIHSLVKMSKDARINAVMKSVTFDGAKARVIAAAPSIWTWTTSPIMFDLIDQLKLQDRTTYQTFLKGPEGVRDMLLKMRSIANEASSIFGTKFMAYNNDQPKYDSSLRGEHGQIVYDAVKGIIPRAYDRKLMKYLIGISLIRKIQYLEKPIISPTISNVKAALKVMITENLKSGEPTTNWFGSTNLFICLYAARRAVNNLWDRLYEFGLQKGLNILQTDGDDNITLYECNADGSILEDLGNTVDYNFEHNGLLKEDPRRKGELGYFYTQFRLTDDDRFITPLSRLNLYYKESSRTALPAYTYTISMWQKLEYRYDCKGFVEFMKRFVLPYDITKMGTVDNLTGKRLTFNELRAKLKMEADANGMSTSEMLFKGNPYDDRMMDKDGDISHEWLRNQYEKLMKLFGT